MTSENFGECDENNFDNKFIRFLTDHYWKKPDIFFEVDLYNTTKGKKNELFPFKGNIVKQGPYQEYFKKEKRVDIVIIDHGRKKALFFERKFKARSEGILSAFFELSLIDSKKLILNSVNYEMHPFLLSYNAGNLANAYTTKKEYSFFEISQKIFFKNHLDTECRFLLYDERIPGMDGLDSIIQNKIMNDRTYLLKLIK